MIVLDLIILTLALWIVLALGFLLISMAAAK